MVQGPPPTGKPKEDTPAYVEKTAAQLQFLRIIVLYVVNNFTGVALKVIKTLRIDWLLQKATPGLRTGLAALVRVTNKKSLSGGRLVLNDKRRKEFVVYSAINVTNDTFSPVKYLPKDFPFEEDAQEGRLLDGIHEWRVHFLSLCVKAAYEDQPIFANITTTDWEPFRYVTMLTTEGKDACESRSPADDKRLYSHLLARFSKATADRKQAIKKAKAVFSFIPQTRAHVITNEQAVVLVFRGTEPTNLIQWATDASCEMTEQQEVKGQVHEGFYAALFYRPEESEGSESPPHALFRCICERLAEEVGNRKSLYVTGHSLGGALVSVFAHCLAKLATDNQIPGWKDGPKIVRKLMERVMNGGGIYTFAGPLAGDCDFRSFSQGQYGPNLFRIVHAGDWVPQVPPYGLGYRHHAREYYLTTFGDLCADPDDIEHWRRIETAPLSFFALYIWKMLVGMRYRGEFPVRTMERFLLLFIAPGLSDHWPSDYERCLRKFCELRAERADSKLPEPEGKHAAAPKHGRETFSMHGPGQNILKSHLMPKHVLVPAPKAAWTAPKQIANGTAAS